MSHTEPKDPKIKVPGVVRGLGEIAEFLRESTVAVLEVVTGRGPTAADETPRAPKTKTPRSKPVKPRAPNQGKGPLEKIAPFPIDD